MKRYNSTLIKMTRRLGMAIAALLMLSTMASCSDQDPQTSSAFGEEAYLNLSFSTASNTTSRASRAGDIGKDETPANPTTESDIHSIKVWVFKSDSVANAKPIAYKEDNTPTAVGVGTANGTYTLNLRFLRKINGEELKNIDLYILANSESTNMTEKLNGKDLRSITRAELQDVTFDKPFGITKEGKAQTTEVPGKGLPISRAITNIAIANHVADTEIEAKDKGISIPLVRAVSKLHFYFARTADANAMTGNVKVTRIEIDGKTFPTASYVFPDEEKYDEADANKSATSSKYDTLDYEPTALKLPGVENSGIKAVEDPKAFIKKSQTAQEYLNAFTNAGIESHHLSYLRDTNKPIKGTIYYQLAEDGSEKFREFTIPSEDKAIRNRELVVYGYFLQGGALCLDLQPIVSDWYNNIEWDYTDKVSIEMERPAGDFGDPVEVHYGNPNGGGPAITLKNIDTGNKNWILQCDNPDFAFYVNGETYDTVSKSDITGNSFTFYVVPKRNKDLAVERNFDTNVFIVLAPDMRKVLFNVGKGTLPGDDFNIKFTQGADRSGI